MYKPMTSELRKKIKTYIKNKKDISELIADVNLQGENLDYAIIKHFKRHNANLSKTSFQYAKIGTKNDIVSICDCNLQETNFSDTIFVGKTFLRRNDARNSLFNGANCANVEYQYTDFRGATFCEAVLRIGTSYGYMAKFDESLFQDLAKYWNVKIILKSKKEMDKIKNIDLSNIRCGNA